MFLPGEHLLGPAVDKTMNRLSNRSGTAKLLGLFSPFTSKQIRKASELLGA